MHRRIADQSTGTPLEAATHAAAGTAYDVVCLDLGLPDGDGLDLCKRIRSADGLQRPRRIPALTARDAVASRIAGLDAGADDYLTKPFDFDELVLSENNPEGASRRGVRAVRRHP